MGNKQKVGGKSKKGQQSAHHKSSGKYVRQKNRTTINKMKAWKKYLENNPKDEQNKKVLEKLVRGAK